MTNPAQMPLPRRAPDLAVGEWLNTPAPLTLEALRGRPVLLHAFQLLCPGCVSGSIPQVRRVETVFARTDLVVIGLHTVFEHHAAIGPATLRAFLHEYGIRHPVGIDLADGLSDVPVTMRRFGFRGTPSSVLIGRDGSILHRAFGVEDDLAVGARIAMALAPTSTPIARSSETTTVPIESADRGCAADACELPAHTVHAA